MSKAINNNSNSYNNNNNNSKYQDYYKRQIKELKEELSECKKQKTKFMIPPNANDPYEDYNSGYGGSRKSKSKRKSKVKTRKMRN